MHNPSINTFENSTSSFLKYRIKKIQYIKTQVNTEISNPILSSPLDLIKNPKLIINKKHNYDKRHRNHN